MKIVCYILLFLIPYHCIGQLDSIITLDNVYVNSTKLDASQIGKIIKTIDSSAIYTQQFGTLQQHLSANSTIFIKNYGANNLSSVSVRGSNASQVATLWNGFNLNMLSQSSIDLNLIPSFFVDKIAIEYGASASKNGSGAIGATLNLHSNLALNNGHLLQIGQHVGSFNNYTTTAKYCFSNKKFASSTKFINTNSLNNFSFYPNGSVLFSKEELPNNKFKQIGVLQENKIILNTLHIISTGIWWQKTARQLPPSITSTNTFETQADNHTRLYLHLNSNYGNYTHTAKFVASNEYLRYQNPKIGVDNDYVTNRLMLESEHQLANKIAIFSVVAQYNYGAMKSEKYIRDAIQNRLSFQANAIKYLLKNKLQLAVSARQEFVTNQLIPITYSANSTYIISKNWKLNAVANSIYRIPTFNDLFWAGTGNPNLKSENGFGQDAGVVYNLVNKKTNHSLEIGATIFNRNINNWIMWTPNSNSIWQPQNLLKVWSRGAELQLHNVSKFNTFVINTDVNYAYTLSTNEKVSLSMLNALQKQLIYTPIHLLNSTISIAFKHWQSIIQYQFTGARFTTSDNDNSLPHYSITNWQCRKSIRFNTMQCTLGAGINNIGNNNYQTIAYRAMPLRNYFLSLQMQLVHPSIVRKNKLK